MPYSPLIKKKETKWSENFLQSGNPTFFITLSIKPWGAYKTTNTDAFLRKLLQEGRGPRGPRKYVC